MMRIHLRSFIAAAFVAAAPLHAQLYSSGPDYYAPTTAVGANRLHILANEFYQNKHQLIYTSTAINGVLSKAEVIGSRVSGPAAVYDTDGLHVFVIDTTGHLLHRKRSAAGAWDASWSTVPNGSAMRGRPSAVIYKGTTYIFVIGGDGGVWYTSGAQGKYGAQWRPIAGMKTLQSPSAMADNKRLMVLGISPNTQLGYYVTMTDGTWSPLKGLITDAANAPLGQLIVAAGDDSNSVYLSSVRAVPKNTIMVADILFGASSYDGEQLDAVTMTSPILTRHVDNSLGIIVRSASDKLLWYRQLKNGTWTGWSKVDPPR